MLRNNENNLLVIISSPSGAGKTSICKTLLENDNKLSVSISDTTRSPRRNEKNGRDYNFINEEEFKEKIKNNEYIEYANVFGNYYGSLYSNIELLFQKNMDVLFDIDWQGAKQLRKSSNLNILSIFIVPPSKESIYERLMQRALESGDNNGSIRERFKSYEEEMSHKDEYDYIVINDNFDECILNVEKIINNERLLIKS